MPDLTMSLAAIRWHQPCSDGWTTLLRSLGYTNGTYDPERRVSLADVVRSNNVADSLWCLRCLDWSDIETRRALIDGVVLPAARRASKYTTNKRVHDCITELDRWINGEKVDLWKTAYAAAYAASDVSYTTYIIARIATAAAYAASDASASDACATAAAYACVAAAHASDAYAASDADAEKERQRQDIIALCAKYAEVSNAQ